ncbi:MAG TPA: TRAP transporter large permease [Amaricoccus sp.]|uniref:TRAP transporter large permease n=1 Tax=Amaricoccus sp. TaxID=1872485 RepID=UPI002C5FCE2A|nr:TRAP transporter large permease [Amaricoccus sp.]HMQ95194.1 TRAP transporter large permease [Amaricoccus sp.]HMR52728.1 TRAP transporter large permease [Amaricoccus sp.]HMR59950.1 TRAP transporter large permease [Amaricoccus sp.]HMT99641.1 TRAP transporter large permease [Amaricoccus sp.]
MILTIIAVTWLLLVLVGVPIGISMILVSMGYFYWTGMGLAFAMSRMVDGLNSFPMLAVPLFILAAGILNGAGITNHLFGFARALVGHVRGGLGHVNVLASLFFSGMSGSALADAGGLGKMEIEAMRKAGYDDEFAGAVTAASSMIGPLVPPSITMVLYGVISNTSIGQLFLGGVVPGVLCAVALMVMVYAIASRRDYPRDVWPGVAAIGRLFLRSFPALLTPAVIVGGIFSGWFSPTEAAAVTVLYAILIDLLFYRELTWRRLWDAIYETTATSAGIATIIAGVSLLGYVLAREQAPQQIATMFLAIADGPVSFLIAVNLMIFVLGMFIESLVILLIVVPILVPIALGFHIDPVHFGIIVVLNLMISILTPPMGMALFVVAQVGNIPFQRLATAILPWLIPPIVVLILVCAFPVLSTGLPSLMR